MTLYADSDLIFKAYLYYAEHLCRTPSDDEIHNIHELSNHKSLPNELHELEFEDITKRLLALINAPQTENILGKRYLYQLKERTKKRYDKQFTTPSFKTCYDTILELFDKSPQPLHFDIARQLAFEIFCKKLSIPQIETILHDNKIYLSFIWLTTFNEHLPNQFITKVSKDIFFNFPRLLHEKISPKHLSDEPVELYKNNHRYDYEIENFIKQYPQKHDKGIAYVCSPGIGGYPQSAKQYIISILQTGIPIKVIFPPGLNLPENFQVKSLEERLIFFLANQNINYDTVIWHSFEDDHYSYFYDLEKIKNPKVKVYNLTVWEYEHIPQSHIENFTQCDGIIVPTEWNNKIFKKHFTKPITTIHHAIDTINTPPSTNESSENQLLNKISKDNILFVTVCTWTPRKGLYETIETFFKAFNNKDKCSLYVKAVNTYREQREAFKTEYEELLKLYPEHPHIVIDEDERSYQEMEKIYARSDCYIQLTKSEGVGLGCCEMAQRGKPVIITDYGGHKEYLHTALYIPYTLEKIGSDKTHYQYYWTSYPEEFYKDCLWAIPNTEAAIKLLQYFYRNVSLEKYKSYNNRDFIQKNFSYKKIGLKFAALLKDYDK